MNRPNANSDNWSISDHFSSTSIHVVYRKMAAANPTRDGSYSDIPLISVLIVAFNHEEFIRECIESILEQKGERSFRIQIVVVDDCSPDTTVQVALETLEDQLIPTVLIRNAENLGLQRSIRIGLEFCEGEYLQVIGADDYLLAGKFSKQEEILRGNTSLAGVLSGCLVLRSGHEEAQAYGPFSKVAKLEDLEALSACIQRLEIPIPLIQSGLFRREIYEKAFVQVENLYSDDWALLIIITREHLLSYLDARGFAYRIHGNNIHLNRDLALINQLEVLLLLVDKKHRRNSLASILRIHSLTYVSNRKYKAGLYFAFASIFLSGVIGPWIGRLLRLWQRVVTRTSRDRAMGQPNCF